MSALFVIKLLACIVAAIPIIIFIHQKRLDWKMKKFWKGKAVLLTGLYFDTMVLVRLVMLAGASSGIGVYIAERLATLGSDVVMIARRKELLDKVAARCNGYSPHLIQISNFFAHRDREVQGISNSRYRDACRPRMRRGLRTRRRGMYQAIRPYRRSTH